MLKYIAVKVFVTDGSGYDRKGAKIVKSADRLGSLPLWGRTAFFDFKRLGVNSIIKRNGDIK